MTIPFTDFPVLRPVEQRTRGEWGSRVAGFIRSQQNFSEGGCQWLDHHPHAVFAHLHLAAGFATPLLFDIPGAVHKARFAAGLGMLVSLDHMSQRYTIWAPFQEHRGFIDDQNRYREVSLPSRIRWEITDRLGLKVTELEPGQADLLLSYLVLEDPEGRFFAELENVSTQERIRYRKSSWFDASSPADLWHYLIRGSIYDPRHDERIGKRFRCQQCAYAWWTYFGHLAHQTGKAIYSLLQNEVAWTVRLDQEPDGSWRHGYWTEDREIHSRFYLDGLHLLLSQDGDSGGTDWADAAVKGMHWFANHLSERLDDGSLWFLHDSIEGRREHRFASKVFGKSAANSLCVNTHVQALTVLNRFQNLFPENPSYREWLDAGLRALRRVLDHRPGGYWYDRAMVRVLRGVLYAEPSSRWRRHTQGIRKRLIKKVYWWMRECYPRMVEPNGLIERDLSLSFVSDRYHIINLKDLLHLYRFQPEAWIKDRVSSGVRFVRTLNLQDALRRSPYYIEWIDVLQWYSQLIEAVPSEELERVATAIRHAVGGDSLDYSVSPPPTISESFLPTHDQTCNLSSETLVQASSRFND